MEENNNNIADFLAMIANQQALLNIAEVKAPFLCDDPQWQGLRMHLSERLRELGVEEWVNETGEKQRKAISN